MSASFRALGVLAIAAATWSPLAASAQQGGGFGGARARDTVRHVLTIPGRRDGQSTFPLTTYREVQPKQWGVMDFQHYHTTAELNYWMERWATEKPDLVERVQVGSTFG